ncbi:uncharacterized protein BCR38DRAFT_479149 [Pseudomassariella vexata]|uniref:Uncharacterized protein n=1 Tax=Pseudomassariella vexata TaxID=1141098 RepID=A0A1Y2D7U0_9PEZI|nr:uncharacterized protein BCR38DRAFT_479149 [Pseudomassariella vexata]ORY55244.1 hypothetical protein BCR38DRAFT_479149 [Pseudomassariella vexata]
MIFTKVFTLAILAAIPAYTVPVSSVPPNALNVKLNDKMSKDMDNPPDKDNDMYSALQARADEEADINAHEFQPPKANAAEMVSRDIGTSDLAETDKEVSKRSNEPRGFNHHHGGRGKWVNHHRGVHKAAIHRGACLGGVHRNRRGKHHGAGYYKKLNRISGHTRNWDHGARRAYHHH